MFIWALPKQQLDPPILRLFGHFVAHAFCKNSVNSDVDIGNEYFDSDSGQTLFWDGIVMETMVNIDEL